MSNVTTLLDAKSVPEAKIAFICPSRNETYSYGKLRTEMNRVGLGLSALGVKKGDRVCIYLESSPEYLISYFAIWRIGAVAVPTNSVYRGEELLHAINDAGACAIITDAQGAGVVEDIRFACSHARSLHLHQRFVCGICCMGLISPGTRDHAGDELRRWMISATSSIRPEPPANPKGRCSPMATG